MFIRFERLVACLPLGTMFLAFGLVCDVAEGSQELSAAKTLYNQGMHAQRNNNWAEAARLLEQASEEDPADPYVMLALGRSYHQLFSSDTSNFDKAEASYKAFIKIMEEDAGWQWTTPWLQCAQYSLGQLYLEAGAYQAAIINFSEATEACPDLLSDGKFLNAMGMGHYYLGDYEEAAIYFNGAVEVEPSLEEAQYNRWSVLSRLFLLNYLRNMTRESFEPDKALNVARQFRRIAPHYIEGLILEGRIYLEAGLIDEAYSIFAEIVAEGVNTPEILDLRIEIALILIGKGEIEAAKEQLVQTLSLLAPTDGKRRSKVGAILISVLNASSDGEGASASPSNVEQPAQKKLPPVSGGHAIFNCDDCHFEDTKLANLSACGSCHPSRITLHPVDFVPKRELPKQFALDGEGRLVCSSCHQLHGSVDRISYLRFAQNSKKHAREQFCTQCHGADLSRLNPHRRDMGDSKCVFCHATQRETSVYAKKTVDRCNFCHGVLARNHPQKLYFFDEENPIVDIDKDEWDCMTCHLPHGTSSTVNFLRKEVVSAIERVRRRDPHLPLKATCNNCHRIDGEQMIAASWGHALRFQGDVGMLCTSCHTIDKGHHPMGVLSPEAQLQPVSFEPSDEPGRQKRIDCYTCHICECRSSDYRMKLRVTEGGSIRNELCWKCHDQKRYMRRSPHVDDPRYCLYCHETQPSKDVPMAGQDVPKNVCFQCHNVKPHPNGKHLVLPSKQVQIPEEYPLGDEGEIICPTCHDPHQVEEKTQAPLNPRRLRGGAVNLCGTCHQEL